MSELFSAHRRTVRISVMVLLLAVVTIAPVTAAVRLFSSESARTALAPEPAPAAAAPGNQAAAAAQTLTWTASGEITGYATVPSGAVAGEATIVFETSVATGNTIGMQHTLTFDTSTPGYNHDVNVNIVADPNDSSQGHHEVPATLTVGKYRFFCSIPGHGAMTGELVVTDGGGTDTTAPATNATVEGTKDADGNYVGQATATVTATDDGGSGVASIEYALDTDVFSPYTAPVEVDAVGDHTLSYRATDNAGNVAAVEAVQFTVVAPQGDPTPPSTSATVAGQKDAQGNYIGSATVTLAATDDGSGVDKIEYSLDDAAYQVYSAPVKVETQGAHMLHYRATDKAGNVAPVKMESFTVVAPADTTPPQVVPAVTGTMYADWAFAGSATVKLTATDAGSGVASVEYTVDGGDWTAYANPFTVTGNARHTVKYRATDAAGNVSPEGTTSFTVR